MLFDTRSGFGKDRLIRWNVRIECHERIGNSRGANFEQGGGEFVRRLSKAVQPGVIWADIEQFLAQKFLQYVASHAPHVLPLPRNKANGHFARQFERKDSELLCGFHEW